MARHPSDQGKGDGPLMIFGGILIVALVLFGMIWMTSGARIVYDLSMPVARMGQIWRLFGRSEYADAINRGGHYFWYHSTEIGPGRFLHLVNASLQPYSILLGLITVGWAAMTLRKTRRLRLQRKLTPDQLLEIATASFTGSIPIMHLRMRIVRNELPAWARQKHVVEIIKTEKTPDGKPILVDGELSEERLIEWLRAIDKGRMTPDGRLFSAHLGYQMVHFPDPQIQAVGGIAKRLSPVGKVLFALFTAHAFGGTQGIKDYGRARDELNRSCAMHPLGLPNLSVANWIWDKYKTNETAHNLFLQHVWEYTYLIALLHFAKKKGKMGHWEFMWLKAQNRPLFYALNSYGRHTPHAEGAMAFGQYEYELECGRLEYFPCSLAEVERIESGKAIKVKILTPMIYHHSVVRGFQEEWSDWVGGHDDSEVWWNDRSAWLKHTGLEGLLKPVELPPDALEQERQLHGRRAQATHNGGEAVDAMTGEIDDSDEAIQF